jgi:hypothetical protein
MIQFSLKIGIIGLLAMSLSNASAQTAISAVYSDFGGYWTSSAASPSATKPNNHHHLVGFEVGGTVYSTGVDDAILDNNGVSYTPATFEALNVPAMPLVGEAGYAVIHGAAIDGDAATGLGITPVTTGAEASAYLTDGTNGLDLGTGLTDIPEFTYDLRVRAVDATKSNDGVPDFVFTQVSMIPTELDKAYFVDSAGDIVGDTLFVDWSAIPSVAKWDVDFAYFSGAAAGTNPYERDLLLLTFELSEMSVDATNASDVHTFRMVWSGESDPAFVALNSDSFVGCEALQLAASTTPASSAAGEDGAITASISGGIDPYYLVVSGDTLPSATGGPIASGKYLVVARDSGDCATDPIMVNIPHMKCN